MIKVFLFDFGGVISEEGFREGLYAIARKNFLNPEEFYQKAKELIYSMGYVQGVASEESYFLELKKIFEIKDDISSLRKEILSRFEIRDAVIEWVIKLREEGFKTGILSDQTNWLYELNEKNAFFLYFDYVFNSYKLKKTKRDPSIFSDIVNSLNIKAEELVFIDDDVENIKRAKSFGIRTILYTGFDDFVVRLKFFSGLKD